MKHRRFPLTYIIFTDIVAQFRILQLGGHMQIGISFGSLVTPITLASLAKTQEVVQTLIGFGMFFQGLPFRQFHKLNIGCRYIEEPWPGLVNQNGRVFFGPTATKKDRLVFTGPALCHSWIVKQRRNEATQIDHQFNQSSEQPVELHKGLGTMNKILGRLQEKETRIVLDTCHLREVEGYFGNSRAIMRQLVPRTALVHVQPIRNTAEWQDFITGKPTDLTGMLYEIRAAGFDGDFVIETTPFFHHSGRSNMIAQLSRRSVLISEILRFSEQLHRCLNA